MTQKTRGRIHFRKVLLGAATILGLTAAGFLASLLFESISYEIEQRNGWSALQSELEKELKFLPNVVYLAKVHPDAGATQAAAELFRIQKYCSNPAQLAPGDLAQACILDQKRSLQASLALLETFLKKDMKQRIHLATLTHELEEASKLVLSRCRDMSARSDLFLKGEPHRSTGVIRRLFAKAVGRHDWSALGLCRSIELASPNR